MSEIEPITIDLNDLTQEGLELSLSNRESGCVYSGPCIIGTLIPEDRREWLDDCSDDTSVGHLIVLGYVKVPADQLEDVMDLQKSFDQYNDVLLGKIAAKYINKD